MLWNWKNIIKNWIYFSLNQFEANSLSEYQILSFRTKFKQTNGKLKIHLANSFTIKKFLQKCILLLFIIQLRDHQNGHQQMIEWEQKRVTFLNRKHLPSEKCQKKCNKFYASWPIPIPLPNQVLLSFVAFYRKRLWMIHFLPAIAPQICCVSLTHCCFVLSHGILLLLMGWISAKLYQTRMSTLKQVSI